jgi:2'-5' RNA ligase
MIRAFVAVEPDASLRQALAKAQAELRAVLQRAVGRKTRMQWVKPDSVHLTLKFLGDTPEERLADIRAALDRAAGGHARFSIEVEGLGVFPNLRAPRVLWVGLAADSHALARLAADVESALAALGYPPEAKPFMPHLTLARIKDGARDLGRALAQERLLERAWMLGPLAVEAVSLMRSDLQPSGAVYTELCRARLKEA